MRSINGSNTKHILLTIDVEDWFQVENFKPWISFSTWERRQLRVEKNVHRLLDFFDSVKLKSRVTESSRLNAQCKDSSVQPSYPNVPASNLQRKKDQLQTVKK